MKDIYLKSALLASKHLTQNYSTSFSFGIGIFNAQDRKHIYNIYGMVRIADEIVDTFHQQDQKNILQQYKKQVFESMQCQFSANPIIHSFQYTANKFKIPHSLIEAFFQSMEMDLLHKTYTEKKIDSYIYGSAEVIGLMCLKVMVKGDQKAYQDLLLPAKKLGSAFQKINFLRDIKADYTEKGRTYFPNINIEQLDNNTKTKIINEIQQELKEAKKGIKKLPANVRQSIYLIYIFYSSLLKKLKKKKVETIFKKRIRINNFHKFLLLIQSYCSHFFKIYL